MEIITVDLNNKNTLNLNDTIQVQQGDRALPIAFIFKYGTDTVDMSDGKVGFIDGMTANNNNVEFENMGNSSGQCIITLNSYAFQDAGDYQWLYVGIKDSNGNVMTSVPASLNVLENKLDTNLDTGAYRNDFENFKNGLSSEVNELDSSVSYAESCAKSATNDLSSASSMVDGACSYAKSYATSATDKCVSAASQAVSQAISQITTNTDAIAATDGVLAAAMSNNLVANSDLLHSQATTDNVAPDGAWISANGWSYIDKNGNFTKYCGRVWWYGHNCLQINGFDNTSVAAVSKPVYALDPLQANTISASFVAQLSSSDYSGITAYVQASMDGYHWEMPSSSNTAYVVPINGSTISDSWATYSKENITIPKGYCWLRLLMIPSGANCYVWFSAPQINLGSTLQPYTSSSTPITAVVTQDYSSTTLSNGATGSVTAERFNNLVVVRLIATGAKSGDIIVQLPTNFAPRTSQQASSVEADSGGLYCDFLGIDTSSNIVLFQRKFDNSLITTINCNATFSYFLD